MVFIAKSAFKRGGEEELMLSKAVHARRHVILAWLLAGAAIAFFLPVWSQEPTPQPANPTVKLERVPVRQTGAVSGKELYLEHCAVCHGVDGKGNGPAAPALRTPLPDLTLLAKNNGGKFPAMHVVNILDSNPGGAVHGSQEMPIWGPIFRNLGPDPALGHLRALNVTKYIESIQVK
jgi:mono/diheme cytochrome c family protein